MYEHCKAEEDKDMDFTDFITDHLINVDAIFDSHLGDDDQKPHQANSHHATVVLQALLPCSKIAPGLVPYFVDENKYTSFQSHYSFDFATSIFRPPIV